MNILCEYDLNIFMIILICTLRIFLFILCVNLA
jgi:hypothetical protein